MMRIEDEERLSDLFGRLAGRHRPSVAVRLVIGFIMGPAGAAAFALGLVTLLGGNVHLSRGYEILVFAVMTLLAVGAFWYVRFINRMEYEIDDAAFRLRLLPDTVRWEIPLADIVGVTVANTQYGRQLLIHLRDGRTRPAVFCPESMYRIARDVAAP